MKTKRRKKPQTLKQILPMLLLLLLLSAIWTILNPDQSPDSGQPQQGQASGSGSSYTLADIPEYSGEAYIVLNDNQPDFGPDDLTTNSYESYSPLDDLGRCGVAIANVGIDLMPTETRGSISSVKPSGWQSVQYDCVDGKYLYNRCHLIGYQLSGENANKQNLITGTRYLNIEGMLPFENMVTDYVKETENHVLYRVTPIFDGTNLVAAGVQMEAMSVEDNGEGICFHIYAYNVQPGVVIDYATGESTLEGQTAASTDETGSYVLNTSSKKFHLPECANASSIQEANREEYTGSREDLIAQGYTPCGQCNP